MLIFNNRLVTERNSFQIEDQFIRNIYYIYLWITQTDDRPSRLIKLNFINKERILFNNDYILQFVDLRYVNILNTDNSKVCTIRMNDLKQYFKDYPELFSENYKKVCFRLLDDGKNLMNYPNV